MRLVLELLGSSAALVALCTAAPAAAQYYPGYPSPYGYGTPGAGGYGYSPYANGLDQQAVINQCVNAVQERLSGGYGAYGYGTRPYGYGGGRVLGISHVQPAAEGGLNIRGVASSGTYPGYGYAPNSPNLVWRCRTDFRGLVIDVDINAAQPTNDYNYRPWNDDYSPYGYQRY